VTLRRVGDTPIVATMYRIPAGSHEDYAAIDVLVHVLGNAPSGRLHRALVQKGLASSVWSGENALHDPGYAHFGARLSKDAPVGPARDALIAIVEGLASDPIRPERSSAREPSRSRSTRTSSRIRARWCAGSRNSPRWATGGCST
jgi:zinc protease